MPRCVIINCNSPKISSTQKQEHISYHSFPNDPIIKEKWMAATGRKDWFPTKHSTICSKHFENTCFIERKKLRLLQKTACPTIDILKLIENEEEMPNDMDNYMEYHLMGSVSQVRMKPGCMPTRYQCQPVRSKRTSDALERPYIVTKQRKTLIEKAAKDEKLRAFATKQVKLGETSSVSSVSQAYVDYTAKEDELTTVEEEIQVRMMFKFISKATKIQIVY